MSNRKSLLNNVLEGRVWTPPLMTDDIAAIYSDIFGAFSKSFKGSPLVNHTILINAFIPEIARGTEGPLLKDF